MPSEEEYYGTKNGLGNPNRPRRVIRDTPSLCSRCGEAYFVRTPLTGCCTRCYTSLPTCCGECGETITDPVERGRGVCDECHYEDDEFWEDFDDDDEEVEDD